jgi:hypothetical protein
MFKEIRWLFTVALRGIAILIFAGAWISESIHDPPNPAPFELLIVAVLLYLLATALSIKTTLREIADRLPASSEKAAGKSAILEFLRPHAPSPTRDDRTDAPS